MAAPKLFQLTHRFGEREVVKLHAFVDSLRVKEKPAADLIELAGTLLRLTLTTASRTSSWP